MVLGGSALLVVAGSVAGARALGVDDDALRALGAEPKPLPDAGDTALLEGAARDQAQVVADLEALAPEADGLTDLVPIAREQLAALGGAQVPTTSGGSIADLAERVSSAGTSRAEETVRAVSPELVVVLASLSAGLTQLARRLQDLS